MKSVPRKARGVQYQPGYRLEGTRLTIIGEAGRMRGYIAWRCLCDCGTECVVSGQNLRRGSTISCGCYAREQTVSRSTKHGHVADGNMPDEYRCWASMIGRCETESHKSYKRYGARGIKVCGRWRNDYAAFLADMGTRPSDDHSLDRRDNDGHYSCGKCQQCVANGWPANCRWATRSDQQRNKTNNRLIEAFGEKLTAAGWAERTGLPSGMITKRCLAGWSAERALSTPVNTSKQRRPRAA